MKKRIIPIFALVFAICMIMTAYAGEWKQEADGRWWYLEDDGSYPTGQLATINGEMYAFDHDGYMMSSQWVSSKTGYWYYCLENGVMAKNQWIDGLYYVDETGKMLTNCWTPDGYYVGSDGAWMQTMGQSGALSNIGQDTGTSYAVVGSGNTGSYSSSDGTKKAGIYAPSSSTYSSRGSSNSSSSGTSYSGKSSSSSSASGFSGTYYWTQTGERYHIRKSCSGLKKAKKIYSGSDYPSGLTPCSICIR